MNIQYVLPIDPDQRRTRKRIFLDEMERVIPWYDLIELITPYYS
ncbi:IS5/IS1182 family transposase, partial [Comamonadaceae bacterium SL12-8]